MKYSEAIKQQFVHLRVDGKSYSEISQRLKVSKPTLIKWQDEKREEIDRIKENIRQEYIQSVNIQMNERIKLLDAELERAYDELKKRKFEKMKPNNLLFLIENFEALTKGMLPKPEESDDIDDVDVTIINDFDKK